ncbi:zinc transporter ZIP9 isoform X2 [Drosophila novamexicana]|uniref:zinc transporter ZIP9 isoform X2 n=1 Tax=Drosophila novamexicana TaxID=47314 RepID=UPI0011E5EB6D|nr:zinc transporter ZIP9 isoform X2 [Drosophila novamexicana]
MTEETIILILLVIVMLVGSYLSGSIPLVMKLSEEKLKFVTVLGAGLLVGTALTVIIPEGIRSLYMDTQQTQTDANTSQLSAGLIKPHDYSRTIGLSLVLGFVFMMLVDQVSQRKTNKGNDNDKNITATLGLVVHAAADGVALGAAATTSHQDVEIIVFLAIMLHKAPAAFGLVSFLLHEKVERQQIRKHLGIFSLSAPLLTLLTYFGIGQEQKETLNSGGHSGHPNRKGGPGQYDYHVIEESREVAANDSSANGSTQSYNVQGLRYSELIIMICGALLPLVITFGHQH